MVDVGVRHDGRDRGGNVHQCLKRAGRRSLPSWVAQCKEKSFIATKYDAYEPPGSHLISSLGGYYGAAVIHAGLRVASMWVLWT